jgi:hypothetical protein
MDLLVVAMMMTMIMMDDNDEVRSFFSFPHTEEDRALFGDGRNVRDFPQSERLTDFKRARSNDLPY